MFERFEEHSGTERLSDQAKKLNLEQVVIQTGEYNKKPSVMVVSHTPEENVSVKTVFIYCRSFLRLSFVLFFWLILVKLQ